MNLRLRLTGFLFILLPIWVYAQNRESDVQKFVDSVRTAGNFPGLSVAVVFDNNPPIALTSGYADKEKGIPLKPDDRLLQGSVGKTYVAAIAMQLVKKKLINLDEKVSAYLGHYSWYSQIPNAESITVRMLMNHTSGIMRYEYKQAFTTDLTNNPDKKWKPEELVRYILNEQPPFKAGEGWEYSDTNYILLGMIIETVTGEQYYKLLQANVLKPLKLKNTLPSDSRKLKGLVQGYAGADNEFGKRDKVILENGQFVISPQFEWTGGGIYSTTLDLATWGKLLYEGKAFDSTLLDTMTNGVPSKLGKNVQYGLGVIIRHTSFGTTYGHSGFFPGYLTEMIYFPEHKICIAVQTNSSDIKNLKLNLNGIAVSIADLFIDTSPAKN